MIIALAWPSLPPRLGPPKFLPRSCEIPKNIGTHLLAGLYMLAQSAWFRSRFFFYLISLSIRIQSSPLNCLNWRQSTRAIRYAIREQKTSVALRWRPSAVARCVTRLSRHCFCLSGHKPERCISLFVLPILQSRYHAH